MCYWESFLRVYLCCGDGDGEEDDNDIILSNIMDLMGLDEEEDESSSLNPPSMIFAYESESDSVDDEEYYVIYTPSFTKYNQVNQSDEISAKFLNRARFMAKEHEFGMTLEKFKEIVDAYLSALIYCPIQYKKKMIKEYESFASVYPHSKQQKTNMERTLELARNESLSDEKRRNYYLSAIMSAQNLETKKFIKSEYNLFYSVYKEKRNLQSDII